MIEPMRDIASLLLPRPQRLYATGKEVVVKGTVRLVPTASDAAAVRAATRLEGALRGAGFDACLEYGGSKNRRTKGLTVTLAIDSDCFGRRESYRLRVGPSDAALLASDEAGLFHGSSTLTQIFALSAAARDADAHGEPAHGTAARGETIALPGLVIRDWPDFPVRGVMLDVSRDKVPTQATLLALVDMLAGWKINQLQLYFEHAFAYRNHEAVWQNASPFTGPEIRELDAYCKERHIELVPNQNSLGHMERWLAHEPYRQWAECPDGIELPFSPTRIARCLCPTDPRSLAFLTDLYDQLLPHFSSRQLNVGLDEAWEVGLGRSEGACRKSSAERVYLDYLRDVHRLLAERGQTMQFWADIIVHRPELVGELPDDVIALEW
ncbi:MAG TPA: family 20 glycosylhydrolase, partial [Polyangiaceae bacterium]